MIVERWRDRLALAVGRQLANPSGAMGRLLGVGLRAVNRQPIEALVDALAIRPDHRVLDIGCGDGSALLRVGSVERRCGIDRSPTMVATARRRLRPAIASGRATILTGDMMAIPFAAGSFDRLIASNLLYFCADVPAFVRECRRVAHPGALLGIYVTAGQSMAGWRFSGPATHRHFTSEQLEFDLDRAGVARGSRRIECILLAGGIMGIVALARLDGQPLD